MKIKQFTVLPETWFTLPAIFALTDEGELWFKAINRKDAGEWVKIALPPELTPKTTKESEPLA